MRRAAWPHGHRDRPRHRSSDRARRRTRCAHGRGARCCARARQRSAQVGLVLLGFLVLHARSSPTSSRRTTRWTTSTARASRAVAPTPASTCWAARQTSRRRAWARTATAATSSAGSSMALASRCSIGLRHVGFAIVIGALHRRDRRLRRRRSRTTSSCASWTSCSRSRRSSWRSPWSRCWARASSMPQPPSSIVAIPIYARVTRSAVLQSREHDFVTASRALGESSPGHPAAPHPAQLDHAAHRGRDAGHRHGHPRGRGALVPGPRRPSRPTPSGAP